jgi:hypothetical protein
LHGLKITEICEITKSSGGSVFVLWSGKFQGLAEVRDGSFPLADMRSYALPSAAERKAIVRFLRT